jgi:hypothetical protein
MSTSIVADLSSGHEELNGPPDHVGHGMRFGIQTAVDASYQEAAAPFWHTSWMLCDEL